MDLETIFERIDQTQKARTEIEEVLAAHGAAMLKKKVDTLFFRFPALAQLHWDQYTPYWCDGAPCVFGVGEVDYLIYDADGKLVTRDWPVLKEHEPLDAAVTTFAETLNRLGDYMLEVFGDHARVTIQRGEDFDVTCIDHN